MGEELLYLSQADVAAVGLTMAEVVDATEAGFRAMGEGRYELPSKTAIHPGSAENFINAMPGYIPDLGSAGIKWVAGFAGNPARGLPYVSGLLIFNDAGTGLPLSVMDCIWITTMRTAAATAVSAKYLARPESSVVGVLGCGVQGRSNMEALKLSFPLRRVMAHDPAPGVAAKYAAEISERFGLEVVEVGEPRDAVSGCDIIVTAGPLSKTPPRPIQAGWMDAGAFASLVDYDCMWSGAAMAEADKFTTDDSSNLNGMRKVGFFQEAPEIYADLGDIVVGKKPGRETPSERTMAANVGHAIDDMSVAPLIYERALEKGIGTKLPL